MLTSTPPAFLLQLRFALERLLRVPLDWQREVDRNCILYESAYPLAHLVAPFVQAQQDARPAGKPVKVYC